MNRQNHKVIVINPDRCTGCHGCELACSMHHFDVCGPGYSRIRIQEFREINSFVPVVCQSCKDAACIKSCPMNARVRRDTGAVVTEETNCIGCRTCIYACRFGAIFNNPRTGLPMTCDLCENEPDGPRCIEACTMQKALSIVNMSEISNSRSREWANLVVKEYSPPGTSVEDDEFSFEHTGYGSSGE